ncbi:MAG: hypothetical protein AAF555_03540 [Verrucomicrobiota bacterium]
MKALLLGSFFGLASTLQAERIELQLEQPAAWHFTLFREDPEGASYSFSLMREGWLSFDRENHGDWVGQKIALDQEQFAHFTQRLGELFRKVEREGLMAKEGETNLYGIERNENFHSLLYWYLEPSEETERLFAELAATAGILLPE